MKVVSRLIFPDEEGGLPVESVSGGGDARRDVEAAVVEGELLEAGALVEEVEQGERAAAAGARQPQAAEAAQRREEEREVAQVQAAKREEEDELAYFNCPCC